MTPDLAVANTRQVRSDIVQGLRQVVDGLRPELDAAGFHITRLALSSDRRRYSIGYDEQVDYIPEVLVDAVAAVTEIDVDFHQGGTIAIARLTREHLDPVGPRRPTVSIDELLAARRCLEPSDHLPPL
jgi:hypothetical protein